MDGGNLSRFENTGIAPHEKHYNCDNYVSIDKDITQ